jgi:hypothetical protein
LRRFGAVLACLSISAAHKAAPTVFVKAKTREAKGIISSKKAAIPKLQENMISNSNHGVEGKRAYEA